MAMKETPPTWRDINTITDWEFARIGMLLCDHEPHDLALMVVRLEGQIEVCQMLQQIPPKAIANG